MIIQSPQNQSTCEGGTVTFTCVVMFTIGTLGPATWFTSNGNIDASRQPDHSLTDDSDGLTAPANVTTMLTVTNVSIGDNGADYTCAQGANAYSDITYLVSLLFICKAILRINTQMYLCVSIVIHWQHCYSNFRPRVYIVMYAYHIMIKMVLYRDMKNLCITHLCCT